MRKPTPLPIATACESHILLVMATGLHIYTVRQQYEVIIDFIGACRIEKKKLTLTEVNRRWSCMCPPKALLKLKHRYSYLFCIVSAVFRCRDRRFIQLLPTLLGRSNYPVFRSTKTVDGDALRFVMA
jgi:hypothetical protein